MNLYYFGNSLEYIQAEYAASNRSTCRSCKLKIEKDELRLGLILNDDHFNAKYWYHLKCFQLKPRHLEIEEDKVEEKIYNIDRLDNKDFNAVVEHIKSELQRLKNKKKSKKESKKDTKKGTKKQSKKQTKGKNKKDEESEEEQSLSPSESEDESSQSSEESQPKAKKKKKKAVKKVKAEIKVYSDAQLDQFAKLCEKYDGMTANELKEILGKNRQSKNGSKPELVEKCADGKILGQIPTCTSCGGGRLRFDRLAGIYTCPGFMEDTDFIRCGKKFPFSEIKRGQWFD